MNGTHDRETSGFSASRFVSAITEALNRTYGNPQNCLKNPVSKYLLLQVRVCISRSEFMEPDQ